MKIGIDFGSTYSAISMFNEGNQHPEAMTLIEGGSASIPSVVSISKRSQISCGSTAKDMVGKKAVQIYEAFKMLLTEADESLVRSRGYTEENAPRSISTIYLQSILGALTKHRYPCSALDEVVICVPEIWCKSIRTQDGRAILRDILKQDVHIPGVTIGNVRIVTEPEAASAFFAYHYEQETKKAFNGSLLLIDYGGGTLDITLTHVKSNGRGTMEIGYQESCGAGENHPDSGSESTIGSAGIAFMQSVVLTAMREQGLLRPGEQPDYTKPDFVAMMKDLESQLKDANRMNEIENVFGEFGSYRDFPKLLREDPEEFIYLEYGEQEVSITYHHLLKAYRQTIEPVLREQVTWINQRVQQHLGMDPCDPAAGQKDDFKIALVGGFGSFYLVKKQLAEIYRLDENEKNDPRTRNIAADKKELAISLGAALLAGGRVVLQRTSRCSIGLCVSGSNGERRLCYSIRYHQVVKPNQVYYIASAGRDGRRPEDRIVFSALYGNINTFAIEYSERSNHGGLLRLKPRIRDRLRALPSHGFWNLGFSMDENEIVSFHITPSATIRSAEQGKGTVIPLDSYANLFDLTAVEEVTT